MNKQKALENAKEFIDDIIISNHANHDLNKEIETYFDNNILKDDPNLEVLKQELNKIKFDITKTDKSNFWKINKIQ